MSDIVEEMGGYLGDGSEFDTTPPSQEDTANSRPYSCKNCCSTKIGHLCIGKDTSAPPSQDKPKEHICTGGTWNNETKRFECEHDYSTPTGAVVSDEIDIERELMKLKSEDGMYVLTSLTTPATLFTLVKFITQYAKKREREGRIDELKNALDENAPFGEGQQDIAVGYVEFRLAELDQV